MADKTGYIGRNPNDSAVTVARQFFTASGVTTAFTFASGYLTGYLDVYVDGVKKRVADEFTATDGSTFDVLQGGVGAGSTVEAVAYKAFNAAAVSGDITGNFDVSGNTTLGGSLGVTGGTTVTNLVVTGISTLGTGTTVGFANTAFNLGGTPNISVDLLSAVDINVSGAATIGGVLTYEDVTNIDSIGIVTARTGVEVTANGLVVNAGVSTLAADLSIADKLVHTGDTNTALRFPSADTITAETAGVERLRIDSTGDVGLVGIATATGLVVVAGSGIYAGHTGIITAVAFAGNLTGAVTGNADTATTSTNVTVADESSDTTCFPLFATAATGNLPPKSGTNLTFNSSSGALTATSFVGALTGAVTGNADTATNASGLTGTPNIDCGTGSFTGDVDIADKIIHTGDTNTAIRFPAADTFTVETGGSEVIRVDSSQRLLVGSDTTITDGNFGIGNLQVTDKTGFQHVLFSGHSAAAANATCLSVGRSRGTQSSPGYLSSGDHIARFSATSYNGGNYGSSGCIDFYAADQHASNDLPGHIVFNTVPDGSATLTERLRITSAGLVRIPDNGKFTAGAGDDLQIYHDGSNSYIKDSGTGRLLVLASGFRVNNAANNENIIHAEADGAVELYHDNSKKFETTSAGVTVTGTVSDSKGDLRKIIFKQESSAYTLVAADAGKAIEAQGNVTVPNGVFGGGDAITIINDGSSNISILKGSGLGSMFNVADGGNANLTLAGRGMATVYFVNNTTCYVSGGGLS